MDEIKIADKWVEFVDKRVEIDVIELLDGYLIEFNAMYNRNKLVNDFDLAYSFFEIMSVKYDDEDVMG